MDGLERLKKEALQTGLRSEIAKQLHSAYDHVVTDELPPRIERLMRHLDEAQRQR